MLMDYSSMLRKTYLNGLAYPMKDYSLSYPIKEGIKLSKPIQERVSYCHGLPKKGWIVFPRKGVRFSLPDQRKKICSFSLL